MTNPRVICHMTSVHVPFDTRIFHKECVTLAQAGYDVHLVACHDCEETVNGVHVHPVLPRRSRIARMLFTVWDVYRAARKVKADLYHFHDPELMPAALLLKLGGARVIMDVHEDFPDYIRSKDSIPRLFRIPAAVITGLIERFSAPRFDAVIAVVSVIYDRFSRINPETVMVHNFPLLNELTSPAGNTAPRTDTAVYIGNITRDRGIQEMVEAIGFVQKRHRVTLVLGGGFAPLSLEDEMRRLDGFRYVDYRGYLTRPQVGAALAAARIGVVVPLPYSHNQNGYMNKLFEYMAAGLPVVASDFPRWRPIVGDNGCGVLVDSTKPEAIADAICRLLDDPEEAERMGARGRRAVEERYSWNSEAPILLALYHRILG